MDHRTIVWESLLEAEYLYRYHGRMAERLTDRARILEILIAILSTGSVISLLEVVAIPGLTEGLIGGTAILSIISATMEFRKSAALSSSFARRFAEAKTEYQNLWTQINTLPANDVMAQWRGIRQSLKLAEVSELAPLALKTNSKLARRCQKEAMTVLAPSV